MKSIDVLKSVLSVLRKVSQEVTPVLLEKQIRDLVNISMDKEHSRGLVDLLGQIGVLETPEHKGFIHEYKYIGIMAKKSRSTDWSYPVDFWVGKYGINEEAVDFWFGEYLAKFK